MYIVFNSLVSGLGNNGGTRTILLSAGVLESLGNKVDVIANVDNFNWFEHKPVINYIPNDADVIINVAAVDYGVTRGCNVPKKYAWWRGHERWSNSENRLISLYQDTVVKNIVNSYGMKNLLNEYNAESGVIYQGLDFDRWEDRRLRPKNKIRIGALHTKQPRKKWKDFVKLAKILGTEKYEHVGMGNTTPKDVDFLTDFKENANVEELNNLYSSCHIWFAPTNSEGLHNVPMEANLCGCLVVCSDHPLNGMIHDYAFNNETAMVYGRKDINHAAELIRNPNWELIGSMQEHLRNNIGSRETNMKKFIRRI